MSPIVVNTSFCNVRTAVLVTKYCHRPEIDHVDLKLESVFTTVQDL